MGSTSELHYVKGLLNVTSVRLSFHTFNILAEFECMAIYYRTVMSGHKHT